MPVSKLTAVAVSKVTKAGLHGDGGGLYLQVTPTGGKSWLFRFMRQGTARGMGLGPFPVVSLADARHKAVECRKVVLSGRDPINARAEARADIALAEARGVLFKAVADQYITAHETSWRNPVHRQQWRNTLDTYVVPVLGDIPVAGVEVGDVLRVLRPMWSKIPETASRVRGRIETILDFATASGWRKGENPARWKGHLDNLLPARGKLSRGHHAALPWSEIGDLMKSLRALELISARGLEFLILTAARTGEVIGAKWSEVDLQAALWTVPAGRMKAQVEHRVPLSAPAVALLKGLAATHTGDWIFAGRDVKKPLSNMAFLELLKRMDRADLTAHGFRSTFRDWCGEATNYPREVAEAALAHTMRDAVEAAYRRGDALEKRRLLMGDWASYCARPTTRGEVVPLRRVV